MARRLLGISLILMSFGLLWVTVTRLNRARGEVRSLSTQIARLSGDIDTMRAQWPDTRTQQVHVRLPAAEAALLHGPPALTEWMESFRDAAIPLALETEFEFLSARTQALDRVVTVMKTRVDLRPNADVDSPRPAYQRLLELSRHLSETPQRLDVVELSVQGASNSVGSASAVLELWAGPATPTTP